MHITPHRPERRRRDLRGQLGRATYPVGHALGEFVHGLPCKLVGHRWVEASRSARRERGRGKIRFRCSRCRLHADFTN